MLVSYFIIYINYKFDVNIQLTESSGFFVWYELGEKQAS